MNEADYRRKVLESMARIEKAFTDVDPDVAECEQSLGSLVIISRTITSADRSRLILSTQPSVRQIWLALAAKGIAHHFNYSDEKEQWIDDKGKNIELLSFLKQYFKDSSDLDLQF
jgi:iron donor protein CyaY